VYSLEDATGESYGGHTSLNDVLTIAWFAVLLLMSLYLDKASLPSPCWMICGAMARVCQDIGLHRQSPAGYFTDVQLESRARLFWAAYVQDKRVSMKMGRPHMLRAEDCDVGYPGTVANTGIGAVLLSPQLVGVPLPDDTPEAEENKLVGQRAIQTIRATIGACKVIESILGHKVASDGGEQEMRRLLRLDDKLHESWDTLPPELKDPNSLDPLPLAAVRGGRAIECRKSRHADRCSPVHYAACASDPLPLFHRLLHPQANSSGIPQLLFS
jgi:hypothetical protein